MMNKEASNKWSMNAKRWINNNHKGWSPLCMGSSSRWFWLLATSPTLLLGQVQSNLYHRLCHLYHIRISKAILKTCFTRINVTCIVYTNQNYLPCYTIVNFQCGISCSFNVHQLWKAMEAHDKRIIFSQRVSLSLSNYNNKIASSCMGWSTSQHVIHFQEPHVARS